MFSLAMNMKVNMKVQPKDMSNYGRQEYTQKNVSTNIYSFENLLKTV